LIGISLGATACSKKENAGAAPSASAAPEVKGCGADYADPQKEFCVKLPSGYTAGAPGKPSELYSELIDFNGPMSGFTVTVGFTSTNWKTYDDQIAADEKWMATGTDIKVEASGATAGGGKWWSYTNSGSKAFSSTTKSNGNKSLHCSPNNTNIAPEVMDACKSIRAYPK
jgi:hypothetical protein